MNQTSPPPAPTLEQVAERAGVSRSTASRAINGGLKVSPSAQAAVEAAIADLGYTPNRAARSLVTRRTDSVALVVPEPDEKVLNDPYFAGTLRGLTEVLDPADIQLVLLIARRGEQSERTTRYLVGRHVDGAVVVSHHRDDSLEKVLAQSHLPCVFVGRPLREGSARYVDLDNVLGARLATEHLMAVGCRHVATITGPLNMAAGVDRLAGWREALRAAGVSDHAVVAGDDFTSAAGARAAEVLLQQHPDVDGIFAASDLLAAGALSVLARAGRSVPGDVRVVGFDDLGVATSTTPRLTTIRNPVVQMSSAAGRLLLDLLAGMPAPTEPQIFDTELVIRESA